MKQIYTPVPRHQEHGSSMLKFENYPKRICIFLWTAREYQQSLYDPSIPHTFYPLYLFPSSCLHIHQITIKYMIKINNN